MDDESTAGVVSHYASAGLYERIVDALRAAGKDLAALTAADLAPVDQFHIGGLASSRSLAQRAAIGPDMHVLDIGGGLGGPARLLAAEFGCRVDVLDLSPALVAAGERLTALVGLTERVNFRHGSGLELPYEDASFDLVWTQHSSMNIADKTGLYAEAARVLRPGGRLAIHEVVAGPVQPIHFPVPWAREPGISFLLTPDALRAAVEASAFRTLEWVDQTMQASARSSAARPSAVDLSLLLGDSFPLMYTNMVRNRAERRIGVIQALFELAAV